MPRQAKQNNISKWAQWDRKRKITTNNQCKKCGTLIHWRRNKTGLCNHCATTGAIAFMASNWKGGRKLSSNGYIEVYHPEPHPHRVFMRATPYVREHILIWEKTNGKLLPQGYVIHHLNGIKTDNRPENLVAIEPHNHGGWTYSQSLQKRIRELEEQLLSK